MADLDAAAAAAGCSRRTLERWRKAGAPMPGAGEDLQVWAGRLRAWSAARPRRSGRVFEADEKPAGVDWEEESRRALALMRMHDLAVKRREVLPREHVVTEWARRCFALRTKLLTIPRSIASSINVPPEVRAQIEAEGSKLIRDALMGFLAVGELTPTPPSLEQLEP